MRVFFVFFLFVTADLCAQVQEVATPYTGMAGADCALASPWAVFYNPAGSSRIPAFSAGISYRHIFDLKELSVKSGFLAYPSLWGTFGLTYTHYGYEKYNEQLVGVAYGKKVSGFLDVGVKADCLFVQVSKQQGLRNAFFFETGLLFHLPYRLNLGLHACNPFDVASLSAPDGMSVPEIYKASLSWKADDQFLLSAQFDYCDGVCLVSFGAGFSYREMFDLKCGFKTKYNSVYAGLTWHLSPLELGMVYHTHSVFGSTMGVILGVAFR